MKNVILAVLIATTSTSVAAFDVDGFRTGMSVTEVTAAVQRQGWALAPNTMTPGVYREEHYGQDGKVSELGPANFSFCDGWLIAYIRELDFDTEYASKLRDMIGAYGAQPKMQVDQSAWDGPGGGYLTTVRTTWTSGRERVEISFTPEEHTGNGALKHYRSANISYVLPGACPSK